MRKPDSNSPTLLGQLVAQTRAEFGRAGGCPIDAHTWERAMGQRIASRSSPEFFRDGVLTLRVATSVWAQELSLLSVTIKQRLAPFGFAVTGVRCRVGQVDGAKPAKLRRPAPQPPPIELPHELSAQLARVLDEDLRAAIETAAKAQLQLSSRRTAQVKPQAELHNQTRASTSATAKRRSR